MIQMELLKLSAALAGPGRPKLVFIAYVDDGSKRRAGLKQYYSLELILLDYRISHPSLS
jgi:hypothetical protein